MRRAVLFLLALLSSALLSPGAGTPEQAGPHTDTQDAAPPPPQSSFQPDPQSSSQAQDLRVRLYAIHSPAEIRVSPLDGSARFRLCEKCVDRPLAQPIQIRGAAAGLALSPGGSAKIIYVSGAYRIETPGNEPLGLRFPLELRAEAGRVRVEALMPLEEYVAAVVAGEGVGFTSVDSLEAMVVVARTFAMHFRGRHRAENFDLCDTTHCQDLRLGAVNARMRAAAEATRGEILWYDGRPAATYHHRHCGGSTEDARVVWPDEAVPYLRAQKDVYCLARDAGTWRAEIAKRDVARALAASHLPAPAPLETLTIAERSGSGRAVRLLLGGPDGVEVRAADLRFAIGRALGWEKIPSDLYDLHDSGDAIVFEGRGAGHGVGMCQTGAAELGARGKSYREILAFYFPGTILSAQRPIAPERDR
jgi:stage II sporulation protein D